jgi:hypothetical protein
VPIQGLNKTKFHIERQFPPKSYNFDPLGTRFPAYLSKGSTGEHQLYLKRRGLRLEKSCTNENSRDTCVEVQIHKKILVKGKPSQIPPSHISKTDKPIFELEDSVSAAQKI